jgi:hypothetical protein
MRDEITYFNVGGKCIVRQGVKQIIYLFYWWGENFLFGI